MALSTKRPSKGDETRAKLLKDVTEKGGKPKRLNAEVEPELYRKIKLKALDEDRSISEITRELWVEYLSS